VQPFARFKPAEYDDPAPGGDWGLYDPKAEEWLPVMFRSEREAAYALERLICRWENTQR
jgi:hypothetical protein